MAPVLIGAALPETGGLYMHLRRAWGGAAGFVFGWAMAVVLVPSSVGYFAQVSALFDGPAALAALAHQPHHRAADGRHLAVGPLEPQFYIELLRLLDLDLPDTDPRHPRHQFDQSRWPEAKLLWEKLFKTRTRDEWSALLEQTDACVAPVLGFDEARHHPHFVARTAYRSVGGVELPVPAPRFADAGEQPRPVDPVSAPVAPGTDSDAILTELGWSIAKIAAAREQRAVSG